MKEIAAITLLMPLGTMASAALTLPVSDDFDGINDLNWVTRNSVSYSRIEAVATDGDGDDDFSAMSISSTALPSMSKAICLSDDDGQLQDYKVTAWIYIPDVSTGTYGIILRAQDLVEYAPFGYYFVYMSGLDQLLVYGITSTGYNWLHYEMNSLSIGWHEFEAQVIGTQITTKIDGNLFWQGNDSTFSQGYVCLFSNIGEVDFSPTIVDSVTIDVPDGTAVGDWAMYD